MSTSKYLAYLFTGQLNTYMYTHVLIPVVSYAPHIIWFMQICLLFADSSIAGWSISQCHFTTVHITCSQLLTVPYKSIYLSINFWTNSSPSIHHLHLIPCSTDIYNYTTVNPSPPNICRSLYLLTQKLAATSFSIQHWFE